MSIYAIAILVIAALLFGLVLRRDLPQYALFVSILVCVILYLCILTKLQFFLQVIEEVRSHVPIEEAYITMILKMLGITYIAQFLTNLCKESGFASMAGQVELFAKISILFLSLPAVEAVLECIYG